MTFKKTHKEKEIKITVKEDKKPIAKIDYSCLTCNRKYKEDVFTPIIDDVKLCLYDNTQLRRKVKIL